MEDIFSKLSLNDNLYDINYINTRIKSEICYNTIKELSDENLLNDYKNCKSTINSINKLEEILNKNTIEKEKIDNIIKEYTPILIPPGTKGSIRGIKFNKIVENYIKNIEFLKNDDYIIEFEKKCDKFDTSEIPDWFILNKNTNKIIIGMNQLDLWSGGHQINRGSKYLKDFIEKDYVKIVCVVCNEIFFKSCKNKAYNLFQIGYKNDTLCYIKNLENIIKSYFN